MSSGDIFFMAFNPFILIYINDIHNASNILEMVLFADDTNVFYSHNDLSDLTNIMNTELRKLSDWFKANKLSINVAKSKYMIFKPRQKTIYRFINKG